MHWKNCGIDQKLGVLDYYNNHGISALTFIEDTVSGKSSWRERAIGNILEKAEKGDVIVASEISRLGRSTLQALEIDEITNYLKKGINKKS